MEPIKKGTVKGCVVDIVSLLYKTVRTLNHKKVSWKLCYVGLLMQNFKFQRIRMEKSVRVHGATDERCLSTTCGQCDGLAALYTQ